jgi:hypothetical protein
MIRGVPTLRVAHFPSSEQTVCKETKHSASPVGFEK